MIRTFKTFLILILYLTPLNLFASPSDSVTLRVQVLSPDSTPPTGTVLINNGDAATNSAEVTLSLSASDPSPYTKLLLHADGANGATTFSDASANPHVITAHGDSRISTSQSKFGAASAFFDGNGDYLATSDSPDFNFGSDSFTIDFWLYKAGGPTGIDLIGQWQPEANGNLGWLVFQDDNNGKIGFAYSVNGTSYTFLEETAPTFAIGSWHHLAVVRDNTASKIKVFVDGNLIKEADISPTTVLYDSSLPLTIASRYGMNLYSFNGWLDEIRISKGIARWTSNFTPPSAPYTNDGSGMGPGAQMRFSNDNTNWSDPISYAQTATWTLASGDGEKTVWAKFKDAAGNWSTTEIKDTIILDTTKPTITSISPLDGAKLSDVDAVLVFANVDNPDSSPLEYQFSIDDAVKQSWSAQSSYNWPAQAGSHRLKIEVRDMAGQDSKEAEVYILRQPLKTPE